MKFSRTLTQEVELKWRPVIGRKPYALSGVMYYVICKIVCPNGLRDRPTSHRRPSGNSRRSSTEIGLIMRCSMFNILTRFPDKLYIPWKIPCSSKIPMIAPVDLSDMAERFSVFLMRRKFAFGLVTCSVFVRYWRLGGKSKFCILIGWCWVGRSRPDKFTLARTQGLMAAEGPRKMYSLPATFSCDCELNSIKENRN